MALRKQKPAHAKTTLPPPWAAAHLHAAGIAVGAAAHDVAVPPRDDPQPGRCFAASTAALDALAAWLGAGAITPVAMASPGGSWIPLFARREARGFAGLLVDPQHVQHIKGQPTSDVHDCPWRQRRHPCGLLASAFRPTDQICGLRRSLRQRARLLTSAGQPIQPRHKARTPMHHKVSPVVSDRTGVTGLAMLRARLAGARDPGQLAPRRADRCQHDEATIARALEGHGREAPLGSLAPAVAL
jgi:transposase